jgi:hypothetical protein
MMLISIRYFAASLEHTYVSNTIVVVTVDIWFRLVKDLPTSLDNCRVTSERTCSGRRYDSQILGVGGILWDGCFYDERRRDGDFLALECDGLGRGDVGNGLRLWVVGEEVWVVPEGCGVGSFGYVAVAVGEDVQLGCIAFDNSSRSNWDGRREGERAEGEDGGED